MQLSISRYFFLGTYWVRYSIVCLDVPKEVLINLAWLCLTRAIIRAKRYVLDLGFDKSCLVVFNASNYSCKAVGIGSRIYKSSI
jgi:hypothetical protein